MKQSKQSGGTIGSQNLYVGIPAPKLEGVPEAVQPFVEMSMKMQSELLELCGHRSNAWLDCSEAYSTCKTMEDFTAVQNGFLTRMQSDYAHFLDGILRDTLIEQDEFEEEKQDQESKVETSTPHREAA